MQELYTLLMHAAIAADVEVMATPRSRYLQTGQLSPIEQVAATARSLAGEVRLMMTRRSD